MMLTVHGLPMKTKFQDVKDLIKQECNIPDFILDNLVDDGFHAKKVRIGLTNENDGYRLMKCLDGFRMSGSHVLKIIPVKPLSQPQSSFEPRSSYSNQSRNDYSQSQDYSSQHDYHRQSNTVNPPSHASPHSSRNAAPETRQATESRGLLDARQSLSQAMADSRSHQDRYQGPPASDSRSTDFRDPSRGPLVPPAIGPASMDTYDSRGTRPMPIDTAPLRGQDSYRGSTDHRQPDPMNCQQWSGGDQWSGSNRVVPNQNAGYSYQQPQGNAGYVQQPNIAPMQTGYAQNRAPQIQPYQQNQQPKLPAPSRNHVLRSVQLVDAPIAPRAAPAFPSSQKPVTIMKDNFQGPSQYNVTGQPTQVQGTYQGQGTQAAWAQQGQTKQLAYDKSYDERRLAQDKRTDAKSQPTQDYDKRRFSPTRSARPTSPGRSPPRKVSSSVSRPVSNYPERRASPTRPFPERRASPSRHVSSTATDFAQSGRRVSPSKISPAGRRSSPTRKTSPRRASPIGRRASPRRISPSTRRISPRRASPSRKHSPGRRASPSGKLSPRRASPPLTGRRVSPFGRKNSPGRRTSPGRRISPGRRVSAGRSVSPPGKRGSPRRNDPRRMSPNERRGGRLESPRRYSPKRSPPRGPGRYSPNEKYDSEMSGSKSAKPIRPAYEPTQAQKYTGPGFRPIDTQYAAASRNEPKIPAWQNDKTTYPAKKDDRDVSRMGRLDAVENKSSPRSRSRSPVKDRYRRHSPSPRSPRRSWALEKRRSPDAIREPPPPPLWPGQDSEDKPKHPVWDRNDSDEERRFDDKRGRNDEKYTPRFSPRRDDRHEYRDERNYHPEDRGDYRRDSPHRDEKKLFNDVDKDFNDIYQRAVEFRRKTEELRLSNDRRNRSYDEEDVTPTRETPPTRKNADRPDKQKPNWIPIKIQMKEIERNKYRLEPAVKEKRDKAVVEIANRILEPHNFIGEHRHRVMEELKLSIYNIMLEMFKDKDVSYIELVIKFRARYDAKDEEKILQDVLTSMPSHYRNMLKRKGEGATEVAPKVSRRSPAYTKEEPSRPKLADSVIPDWNHITPPKILSLPVANTVPPMMGTAPVMVQPPVYLPTYQVPQPVYQQSLQAMPAGLHANLQANLQSQIHSNLQKQLQSNLQSQIQSNLQKQMQSNLQTQMQSNLQKQMQSMHQDIHSQIQSNMQSQMQSDEKPLTREQEEGYDLYLCQDDFEPFSENQAEKLKNFLVSQMFKASETGDGWAPVFSLKGLHSMYRYELSTQDEASKNWIVNLDFSEFEFFNVLVYTKEELWYERAAIWLPGHSRYRNIEPLEKLRLQNQHTDGINIGKWKFVKRIVTIKGTRLYVDMPPSSARALEKKKMMLSYELGKVNVYLKAVAIDKEVFDAGLKTNSITDPSRLADAVQGCVMPTLPSQQVGIVKVTLNGAKSITIQQAGKIKEMIVYNLFKYHQQDSRSRTDFLKYGFCPPNCIGIVPENSESKRWLMGRSFGKLNKQSIVVVDGEDANTKYFRMRASVPILKFPYALQNTQVTMERLKNSNQGVKGLNFNFWKPVGVSHERGKGIFEVDVDMESAETLIKLHFKLDYVDEHGTVTITFKSDYSLSKLEDKIRKYKAELVDSYDVANMELDSESE